MKKTISILSIILVISLILNAWLFYKNTKYNEDISNSTLWALSIAMKDLKSLGNYNPDNPNLWNSDNLVQSLFYNVSEVAGEFNILPMIEEYDDISPKLKRQMSDIDYLFNTTYLPMVYRITKDNIITDEEKSEVIKLSNRINSSFKGTIVEYKKDSNNEYEVLQKIEEDLERFLEFKEQKN